LTSNFQDGGHDGISSQNGAATWCVHPQCMPGAMQQSPPVPDL